MRLHTMLDLVVVEACTIMKEGLPYLIVGSIVEVLGLEGSSINHGKARVGSINDVLLN